MQGPIRTARPTQKSAATLRCSVTTSLYVASLSSASGYPLAGSGPRLHVKRCILEDSWGRPADSARAQQLPALRVLIYSVYETETPHPFVVLVLPEVSQAARQELAQIAEDVIPVQQLAYPYDGKVKFELGIIKQCRYSKLHLWAQTQFRSLIYLDVDTAVQKVSRDCRDTGVGAIPGLSGAHEPLLEPRSETDHLPPH